MVDADSKATIVLQLPGKDFTNFLTGRPKVSQVKGPGQIKWRLRVFRTGKCQKAVFSDADQA